MKLNELNHSPVTIAKKALKEHFNMPFNLDKMSLGETRAMLKKVRGLVAETRQTPRSYKSQNDSTYLKLVFMEQALSKHLASIPRAKVVLENAKIEESQVYLAAQALVDSIQKMLEDVGQMQVKELPALVSSIETEMDVNESVTFNDQVSQVLDGLSSSLKESLDGLKAAVNGLTGQETPGAFDSTDELGGDDMGMGGDDMGMGGDDMGMGGAEEPVTPEEPEEEPVAGVGRTLR